MLHRFFWSGLFRVKVTIPEHYVKEKQDRFHLNGFAHPMLRVIASDKPGELQQMEWGTDPGNGLMEHNHNTKKRMPMILDSTKAREWLSSGLTSEAVEHLMMPFKASKMKVYAIKAGC